jgi:integrase
MREARARRDLVAEEIAAGRNPFETLRATLDLTPRRTFREWGDEYRASRVDVSENTLKAITAYLNAMRTFESRDPETITTGDVQEWVGGMGLKPKSVRCYVATLRAVLDFAQVDPNPARDPRVKLPREEKTLVDPPTSKEVETIIALSPKRFRLPLRVLAATGLRVGEAHALTWSDVHEAGCRFRIRAGKTAAARRWVAVPKPLMEEVAAMCPREDRTAERVFAGFSPDAAKYAMARACRPLEEEYDLGRTRTP